jgi:aminoglycoside/choline kinase family phosphotransferase
MHANIPKASSEITAEWLTSALRAGGKVGDVTVERVELEALAAGVGYMGEVVRLRLTTTGGDAPATMIAKVPTQDPTLRAMMKPTRVYEREARFFDEIAAGLPISVPTCYRAAYDLDADDYLILMEDLGSVPTGDQAVGVSVDAAEQVLRTLARYHAHFWGNRNGLATFDFVPDTNGALNKFGEGIYAASLPGFMAGWGHLLVPEMEDPAARFGPNVPQLLDRFFAMPSTLVHGDFRADNLFFGTDADGQTDITVIDFQAISRGGGANDVGYFMSQNLSIDDRRAHEHELLDAYHATLEANGVTGYGRDQLFEDYKVGVMYGWVIPVLAGGSLDTSSERAKVLWTAVIDRVQAAILDLGCPSLLTV